MIMDGVLGLNAEWSDGTGRVFTMVVAACVNAPPSGAGEREDAFRWPRSEALLATGY
jgi:hypothetical protein